MACIHSRLKRVIEKCDSPSDSEGFAFPVAGKNHRKMYFVLHVLQRAAGEVCEISRALFRFFVRFSFYIRECVFACQGSSFAESFCKICMYLEFPIGRIILWGHSNSLHYAVLSFVCLCTSDETPFDKKLENLFDFLKYVCGRCLRYLLIRKPLSAMCVRSLDGIPCFFAPWFFSFHI